ncbi:hypothetical protein FBUS_11435, partial [Fasciolopsis buskii]
CKIAFSQFPNPYRQGKSQRPPKIFHRSENVTRQALRNLVHEIDSFCERTQSPATPIPTFSIPHDPSMPTLSPQQPTSSSTSTAIPNASGSCTEKSAGEHQTHPDNILQPLTSGPAVLSAGIAASPSLPLIAASGTIECNTPSLVSVSLHSSTLPNGLIPVERQSSSSPTRKNKKKLAHQSSMSVVRRRMVNSWLTELAMRPSRTLSSEGQKRPALCLAVVDSQDCEQTNSSDSWFLPLPAPSSPPGNLRALEDTLNDDR